ncbi:MAG: hypothetical protein ACPG7F_21370, partial [Aggregatilineales bacterium]
MIELKQSTGNPDIDHYIEAIISIYETTFPARIRGYYLVGSYGDDTAVSGSDIDMEILFKDAMTSDEIQQCNTLKAACRTLSPIHLDLPTKTEANLAEEDTVALKLNSKFVYGEDTRALMPLPAMDVYLSNISLPAHRGLTFRLRGDTVSLPLDYPVPEDEFYGYIPDIYRTGTTPIKLWVVHVGWLATFLLVYQAKVYVPSKRHMLQLYREHINDAWTDFIAEVYERGRNEWHYKIPQDDDDLAHFKDLCRQTLAFEIHAASVYLKYL